METGDPKKQKNHLERQCPIFLGNFTPKTSNCCLKNRALGFPGRSFFPSFERRAETRWWNQSGYCPLSIVIGQLVHQVWEAKSLSVWAEKCRSFSVFRMCFLGCELIVSANVTPWKSHGKTAGKAPFFVNQPLIVGIPLQTPKKSRDSIGSMGCWRFARSRCWGYLNCFFFSSGFFQPFLGGGNSNIFWFSPRSLGKLNPFWRSYFFRWVGSTTNQIKFTN